VRERQVAAGGGGLDVALDGGVGQGVVGYEVQHGHAQDRDRLVEAQQPPYLGMLQHGLGLGQVGP
jgi:hypothetical protein